MLTVVFNLLSSIQSFNTQASVTNMSYLNESNLLSKNQNKTLDPIPENISGIGADGAGPGAASSSMQPNRQWWDIMTSPRKEGYATSSLAGLSTGGLVDGDGVMNAEEGPDGPALDSVEADTSFRSSWKFLTLIGLLSVCAGLGLYFIAKNGNGGDKGKPPWNGGPKTTLAPSSAPSFQPTYASGEMTTLSDTDLQELDNLFLLLSGDFIYSSTSPQGQARLWLHSDNVTVHNAGLIRVTQRYALCVLFFATSGPAGWTKTFLVKGAHECDWKGIGCDKYRVVVRLATADQNLVGALPEEIGFLTSLDTLSMHHNSLTGTLPEGLLRLDSLTYMDLKLNQLTGTLPASMWSLNALTSLDVSGNLFNGTLSSNMWSLSNVTSLLFYNNSLTGPFPEIPGTLAVPPMVYLWVARNHLTGALPESINRLSATMREFFIIVLFYRIVSWVSKLSLTNYFLRNGFRGNGVLRQ
jgi:Leucine rich repeat